MFSKNKTFKITLDGPAGTGKSTIAKTLANKFNDFMYINTGSMYRTISYYLLKNNLDYNNIKEVKKHLKNIKIDLDNDLVYLISNNTKQEVSNLIRTKEIEAITSIISTYGCVREKLIKEQRKIAKQKNVIMDGRDIGSVVLKDAQLKVYLDASSHERAIRRYNQLIEQDSSKTYDLNEIEQFIVQRDLADKSRKLSPLIVPKNAIKIDTTNKTVDEIINYLEQLYIQRRNLK